MTRNLNNISVSYSFIKTHWRIQLKIRDMQMFPTWTQILLVLEKYGCLWKQYMPVACILKVTCPENYTMTLNLFIWLLSPNMYKFSTRTVNLLLAYTHSHNDINRSASLHIGILSCSGIYTHTHGSSDLKGLTFNPLMNALSVHPDKEPLRQSEHMLTGLLAIFKGSVPVFLGWQQLWHDDDFDYRQVNTTNLLKCAESFKIASMTEDEMFQGGWRTPLIPPHGVRICVWFTATHPQRFPNNRNRRRLRINKMQREWWVLTNCLFWEGSTPSERERQRQMIEQLTNNPGNRWK